MKRLLALLAAAGAAAFVLLRPVPPPAASAGSQGSSPAGWSSVAAGVRDRRPHRTPPPRALAYVAGEVVRPGVYPIAPDARVRDAVALAGGTRGDADLTAVNLAAHIADGDAVVVPARGAAAPAASARSRRARTAGPRRSASHPSSHAGTRGRHRRSRDTPPATQVDINSADAETLATIPGIGDGLAERIVEFRRVNGPFASVDELLDVAGITEHRLDAMIPFVVAR